MKKIGLIASVLLNVLLILYILKDHSQNSKRGAVSEDLILEGSENQVIDEKGLSVTPVNIVLLGNSITHQGNWQEVLQRRDVFNGGKPGWTTQQLSWVIKNFIIPHRPKLCFFKGGINDYTLGISTDRIYKNCTEILDSIHNAGTIPIYTTTLYQRGATDRNRAIDSLNARMKVFCIKRNYEFMDLRPFLCKDGDILDAYIQDDNTHLKATAYPQWAKAMLPILEKYDLN